MKLPREQAGPSLGVPLVSFGAPPDDWMSIAVPEGEPDFSGDDDQAALPPIQDLAKPGGKQKSKRP